MNEQRTVTENLLENYKEYLYREEKSENTVKKYKRDICKLMHFAGDREITKELMLRYRDYLIKEKGYGVRSVNSYIVAANKFFEFMEWYDLRTKTLKLQEELFLEESKELTREDYKKLVDAARKMGNIRLSLIIVAICSTGIRVSELSSFTVSNIQKGCVEVNNKGKVRKVLLPGKLRKQLLVYAGRKGIQKGIIFRTKSGEAISRTNIWRDMKKLCDRAGVPASKVFPHNLRKLFARTYHGQKKDIAKLANILGHSSIETTRIYLRCSSKEYMRELDAMKLVI